MLFWPKTSAASCLILRHAVYQCVGSATLRTPYSARRRAGDRAVEIGEEGDGEGEGVGDAAATATAAVAHHVTSQPNEIPSRRHMAQNASVIELPSHTHV